MQRYILTSGNQIQIQVKNLLARNNSRLNDIAELKLEVVKNYIKALELMKTDVEDIRRTGLNMLMQQSIMLKNMRQSLCYKGYGFSYLRERDNSFPSEEHNSKLDIETSYLVLGDAHYTGGVVIDPPLPALSDISNLLLELEQQKEYLKSCKKADNALVSTMQSAPTTAEIAEARKFVLKEREGLMTTCKNLASEKEQKSVELQKTQAELAQAVKACAENIQANKKLTEMASKANELIKAKESKLAEITEITAAKNIANEALTLKQKEDATLIAEQKELLSHVVQERSEVTSFNRTALEDFLKNYNTGSGMKMFSSNSECPDKKIINELNSLVERYKGLIENLPISALRDCIKDKSMLEIFDKPLLHLNIGSSKAERTALIVRDLGLLVFQPPKPSLTAGLK